MFIHNRAACQQFWPKEKREFSLVLSEEAFIGAVHGIGVLVCQHSAVNLEALPAVLTSTISTAKPSSVGVPLASKVLGLAENLS